jgi:hypothetical protein
MPWNECKPMDERLRFIARRLDGEKMAPLCREFVASGRTAVESLGGRTTVVWPLGIAPVHR